MGTHPIFESDFDCLTVCRAKKESSDEYEPELSEKSDDQSADEPENAEIPEILTERKAKVNRKNIVESEDSDKLSSEAENSDDYNPYAVKKQTGRIQRHKDSDSEEGQAFTPSPVKPVRRPRPKRKPRRQVSSASDSASTTSESEEEDTNQKQATSENKGPIDILQDKFPDIPRSDITRVYYQMSCQIDRTENHLKVEWKPGMFSKPAPAKTEVDSDNSGSTSSDTASEPETKMTDDEAPNQKTKKRKALNSSDEEWCPMPKKKKFKKKLIRPVSSSEEE